MTAQEIEIQLQAEKQTFYSSPFEGWLPSDLIERFKKALMATAPGQHQFKMDIVRGMVLKKESKLNYLEVGMVINLCFSVPFEKLYTDVNEAIAKNFELEKVRVVYNQKVQEMEQALLKKKNTMLSLTGNNRPPLQLIKAEA